MQVTATDNPKYTRYISFEYQINKNRDKEVIVSSKQIRIAHLLLNSFFENLAYNIKPTVINTVIIIACKTKNALSYSTEDAFASRYP